MMKNATKGKIIKAAAVSIDVLVPLIATIMQFPIWVEQSGEATMSGIFLMFAFFSCLPFLNYLKAYFRSPAVWVVWLVLFVFLFALSNIINEMLIVCFVGLIANCIGAILYKIGKTISMKP